MLQLSPVQPPVTLDYANSSLFPSLSLDKRAGDIQAPLPPATEVAPGVFSRKWGQLNVSLDCQTFRGSFA